MEERGMNCVGTRRGIRDWTRRTVGTGVVCLEDTFVWRGVLCVSCVFDISKEVSAGCMPAIISNLKQVKEALHGMNPQSTTSSL